MAYPSDQQSQQNQQSKDQPLSATATAQAQDAAEQTKQAARDAAQQTKQAALDAAQQTKQAAQDAAGQVRQAAMQARDAATSIMQQQKDYGADQMDGIARAAHGAAEQLEGQLPMAAGYVHEAAERLQRVSQNLRERNIEELVGGVGQFARAQPLALFGGAVLAGFALSRFLKSSASRPTTEGTDYDYTDRSGFSGSRYGMASAGTDGSSATGDAGDRMSAGLGGTGSAVTGQPQTGQSQYGSLDSGRQH